MMVQPNFYQSHFLCCSWEPGGRTFHLELPAALRMRILLCNRAALSPAAQHRHMSKLGHNALCCVIQQEQRKAFFHLPPGFRRLWEVHGCGDTSRLLSSCLHPSAPTFPPSPLLGTSRPHFKWFRPSKTKFGAARVWRRKWDCTQNNYVRSPWVFKLNPVPESQHLWGLFSFQTGLSRQPWQGYPGKLANDLSSTVWKIVSQKHQPYFCINPPHAVAVGRVQPLALYTGRLRHVSKEMEVLKTCLLK